MLKNRFFLVGVILPILGVTLAISSPFSPTSESGDLRWLPGPVIIPVTGAEGLSDYHERHPEMKEGVEITVDMSDYFLRHPESRIPADLSDYFLRH
jgi:hypothetical protein